MERLRQDGQVDEAVLDGILHVDRPLPFLCVVRRTAEPARHGAERLVMTQASFLVASGAPDLQESVAELVGDVAAAIEDRGEFGSFLVLELWASDDQQTFRVLGPAEGSTTRDVLVEALRHVDVLGGGATVERVDVDEPAPPDLPPLMSHEASRQTGALLLGVEVPSFFVDETGSSLPEVLRRLQADLAQALQRAVYEFATVQTTFHPEDVRALGPRRLRDPVAEVDHRLASVSARVDCLLAVTPVDADVAWEHFREHDFERDPQFHYRPLAEDPDLLKRELYDIPIEAVEDPSLASLFREKRHELDGEIDLLIQRCSPPFLLTSLRLYGGADPALVSLADDLLDGIAALPTPPPTRDPAPPVDAQTFLDGARAEFDHYRGVVPDLELHAEIRDDLTGVMVNDGRLLIDARLRLPPNRFDALLQHEVGTHVVTWVNGSRQPLHLLRVGLPGYDETQEALAVVAEYVVGGLTARRLTTLAARVLAVQALVSGASFVESFRLLRKRTGLGPAAAFDVTMRVQRAGGFTKDVIYLRGLDRMLRHLADGGALAPLLLGKPALEYVPVIEELCWREVLRPPLIEPRWLSWGGAAAHLAALRDGLSVDDLIREGPK